ncbi:ac145-like protein [Cryptophlebia peltastica nucleopolyhedrovirus]|uniref:Ac145-like protein n=1 Tax=Cryptophlebia peltastica nucleopolyhedrovirus TaxID=2304025 RepID=A0A346RNP0_9ABAC|nr:ac145-like protein [Cryptophlebia peltastica nucleopolyhedrovirus]AXS67687.1 ac145-like protein [Cryptophlebia peltastica nucleopolyhedrovirus]
MWLMLAFFIIVKLLVFHKLQKMHLDMHVAKICPNGFHGLAPDPFDCSSYYLCPQSIQMFCTENTQFDLETNSCVPQSFESGCLGRLYKNLLI